MISRCCLRSCVTPAVLVSILRSFTVSQALNIADLRESPCLISPAAIMQTLDFIVFFIALNLFLLTFALLCVRIEAEPVQGYRLA